LACQRSLEIGAEMQSQSSGLTLPTEVSCSCEGEISPANIKPKERMITKNEKALGEFMAKMAQAQELLAELQAHVDNHMEFNPDEINWGHTGSAGHLVQQLTELTDWAFQRGEYAQ